MFISEMMRLIQMMIFMVVWHTEQNIIKKGLMLCKGLLSLSRGWNLLFLVGQRIINFFPKSWRKITTFCDDSEIMLIRGSCQLYFQLLYLNF